MNRLLWRRLAPPTLLLLITLAPAAQGHMVQARVALPSPAQFTALLSATPNPPRDLYALADRLKLHSTVPIDPIVNARPTDYPVGRVDQFSVYTGNGNQEVSARLAYKTAHAYFYVQQGMTVDPQKLAQSAATFEQHTYPTDVAAFGSPWTPGVDNDQHVTIFNGSLQGGGEEGYVYAEDLYPRSVYPYSNQRKIMFIDIGSASPGTTGYDSTVAHELQHIIRAHLHPMDEAWINEGSSVLAQVLNGYSADGWDLSKAQRPDAQLDAWDPTSNIGYGNGYLWMLYLYEHFGGDRATRAEMADNRLSGMALFDDLLPRLGVHESANQLFADWVVANFLNDSSIDGGRYGYTHTQVRSAPTHSVSLPFTQPGNLHQYAADYVDVPRVAGAPFTLSFTGQPTVPLLDTTPPDPGFWWSNRGDSVDDTLTLPPLDLRSVSHAALRYQVWYDLEKDYDYGYVEVSTDGGKTWYAQHTPHTTASNLNGTNMAEGYTGSSCTSANKAQACWLNEQIDLSRYAGKQILVRFEQVTDDEYNGQGLAVAHVQVPAIGFDGDAVASGWQAAGWVRAINTLAEHWIVQAIVYRTSGISVTPMSVDASGHGTLRVPAGATRVVVVVSPAAPLTTVPSSYTLSAAS
jgi:hypothetical protein